MAMEIVVEGFVQETNTFEWGNVAKVVHNQRGKNVQDEWVTIGKE